MIKSFNYFLNTWLIAQLEKRKSFIPLVNLLDFQTRENFNQLTNRVKKIFPNLISLVLKKSIEINKYYIQLQDCY